jgi:hypothetical protein
MTSPTARSLAYARRSGYTAEVVEKWLAFARVRKDFLGCIDIIALRPGCPILGIQATTKGHVAARVNKARSAPGLRTWLACEAEFECWGWYQDHAGRWQVDRVAVHGEDLAAVALTPRRKRRTEQQRDLFQVSA